MNRTLSDCRRHSGERLLFPFSMVSSPRRIFIARSRIYCGLCLGLALVLGVTCSAYSQDEPEPTAKPAEVSPQQPDGDPDSSGSFSRTISFSRDREMEARLRGAHTAFAIGRSVDGVQILAELLNLPEPHHVQIGSTLRDVRDEAANLLRTGSEELREQFRRHTEVKAAGELKDALANGDYPAIARVADHYPFTPTALECNEILATQFFDHGRFDVVTHTASRWIDRSPDPALAARQSPRLVELWTVALNELGDREGAVRLASRFASSDGNTPDATQLPVAQTEAPLSSAEPVAAWSVRSELPVTVSGHLRTVVNNLSRQGLHPALSMQPLVVQQHIIWRTLTELVCIDRTTGHVTWRQPIADPTIDGIVQMGETKADGNRIIALRTQLGHRVLRNSILGQITCDGERVYTVEYSPSTPPTPEPPTQQAPNNLPPPTDRMPIPEMTFVAYSLTDGTVLWKSHEVWGTDAPHNNYFFGPPVLQGQSLYAVVQREEQLLVLRLDPSTGALDGASVLGEVPHLSDDRRRMSEACPIVWHDGVAICATGAGGVAAFDMYRGQLQWGFRHSRDDVMISQGLLMPPVDKAGWTWMTGWEQPQLFRMGTNVIYGSPETNLLRCLDIANGDLKWEVPIAGTRAIVGGDAERVVLEGLGVTRSLRLKDGSIEREFTTPSQVASAVWLGSVCRVSLHDGQQIDWNPQSGESASCQSESTIRPLLDPAGTLDRINGQSEQTLTRSLVIGGNSVVAHVDEILLRPAHHDATGDQSSRCVPPELAWKPGNTQTWLTALTAWIEQAPESERASRVELALSEWAVALESNEPGELPLQEWTTRWSLTPEQVREISFRSLKNSMRTGESVTALRHALQLMELRPASWETELKHDHWGPVEAGSEASVTRTVRLDAIIRGALRELWERVPPDQKSELETVYREWAGRESNVLDELTQPLEQLSFLPPPVKERPLQWKTLGELARMQLSLRRLSTHEDRATAAAALWRLVELHMARGEWGNAAGLIEQLKRRFASVAVRGNQTAEDLIRQFPESSLVLKNIDHDRRTTWPEREPIVSLIETSRLPESQNPIPVRSERGSLFDRLNLTYAARELQFTGLGKVYRSWALSLPGGMRIIPQQYPAIKAGWAFGQFVVIQFGSELFCLSSLDSQGEAKTSRIKEVLLWPAVNKNTPQAAIDTLGNQDNGQSYEDRPIPQIMGFVRREIEPFDNHGHRVAWVGPVSAGTLCFLQQGMLVCLDTATGQELWRRYDMPAGVRTVGDDSVVAILRDGGKTVELLSPLDGRTQRTYQSDHTGDEWIRNWGRLALAASGQPIQGAVLNPVAPAVETAGDVVPPSNKTPPPEPRELQLKMVDLAGPKTLWERTFPPGSAAFEVDEDWLGVVSKDGTLSFLEVPTGQTVRQSSVKIPAGLIQIATAVTERSIFVTLSPPVTEDALTGSKPAKLKPRQFYVNGPVHAFDRRTGELQWSQQIENRVFPIDQVRDVPLMICADVWKGPLDPMPEVGQIFPKHEDGSQKAEDPEALRVRYWALDSRTGRVVLNTSVNKSIVQYTVERDLAKGWVELRQGGAIYRFSYAEEEKPQK